MPKKGDKKIVRPKQHQRTQPGMEYKMKPMPEAIDPLYRACGKLLNRVAIITGGDSGIGRAVACAFAAEGADIVIAYYNEHKDAHETRELVESKGRNCLLISGNLSDATFCKNVIKETIKKFKKLNILVNNAAVQHPQEKFEDISISQFENTFKTNIFAYFYMTKYALPHLLEESCIINTTSVTAYRGSAHLVDYSATKGAIVSFTRSLSANLIERKIRVNAVAPGPIWTPLIPSSFDATHVSTFGSDTPMKRAGEPREVAPCYVFLASSDSSYMTGQVLHPNGGEIING